MKSKPKINTSQLRNKPTKTAKISSPSSAPKTKRKEKKSYNLRTPSKKSTFKKKNSETVYEKRTKIQRSCNHELEKIKETSYQNYQNPQVRTASFSSTDALVSKRPTKTFPQGLVSYQYLIKANMNSRRRMSSLLTKRRENPNC